MATIYHYCDTNAFLSIVQSKALWLCNTRKMNDHSEGSVAGRMFVDSLRTHAPSIKTADAIEQSLEHNQTELYACCFSEEKDSTVQWMSYADQGRGFAIGFDSDKLWTNKTSPYPIGSKNYYAPGSADDEQAIALTEILYSENQSIQEVNTILHAELSQANDHTRVAAACRWFDTITKSRAFRHEYEWRLIYAPKSQNSTLLRLVGHVPVLGPITDMFWRSSKYGIAPYFKFHFELSAITEIWLGPGNPDHNDKSSRHLLEVLLESNHLLRVSIYDSASPYR